MPNQYSDEDRRKIREHHRNRAITRKVGRKSFDHLVAELEDDELRAEMSKLIKTIYAEAQDGTNYKLMAAANKLETCWRSLELRGTQLQLPM